MKPTTIAIIGIILVLLMLTTPKIAPTMVCKGSHPIDIKQTHGLLYKRMGIECADGKKYFCTITLGIPHCQEVNKYAYYAEYGPYGEITHEDIVVVP